MMMIVTMSQLASRDPDDVTLLVISAPSLQRSPVRFFPGSAEADVG